MFRNRPVIGLTGGIGSGKSTAARLLAERGCLVTNSDELAREALRDPEIRATIRHWWGGRVFDADGEVDRRQVALIVFGDPDERRRLEGLTHPWIEARRQARWTAAPERTAAFVIDAPLLMEAGLDDQCDAVIFIDADRAVRARRVAAGRGWSARELLRREESQLPLDVKRERADYVVTNNVDDLEALRARIDSVFESILRNPR